MPRARAVARAGADDQRVEVFDAGLLLRRDAIRVLRPGRGHELDVDAEFTLEGGVELFAQIGARRNADDDLTFPLRGGGECC
jgi:hypothetical protein